MVARACRKVFKKLSFELSEDVIESLVQCRSGTVERVLLLVRTKIDRALQDRALDPHRERCVLPSTFRTPPPRFHRPATHSLYSVNSF